MEWTRPALWKSTARLEFRNADTGDNMLASFGYARKLTRDWTFLGRTLWDVSDVFNNQTRGWSQLGFAWRETDRNRWNAVMRYENKAAGRCIVNAFQGLIFPPWSGQDATIDWDIELVQPPPPEKPEKK